MLVISHEVFNYRDRGRVRQRVVANLGRADVLAQHLTSLVTLLRTCTRPGKYVDARWRGTASRRPGKSRL